MPVKEIPTTWRWVCDLCAVETIESHHHLPLEWAWVRIETRAQATSGPRSTVVCRSCLSKVHAVLGVADEQPQFQSPSYTFLAPAGNTG